MGIVKLSLATLQLLIDRSGNGKGVSRLEFSSVYLVDCRMRASKSAD